METASKTQKKRKTNSHSAKNRLQIGDMVSASVGPTKNALTPSGRKLNAKQKIVGKIIESIANNKYLVHFSNGIQREMSSTSLKKPSQTQIDLFEKGLNNLINKESKKQAIIPTTFDNDLELHSDAETENSQKSDDVLDHVSFSNNIHNSTNNTNNSFINIAKKHTQVTDNHITN